MKKQLLDLGLSESIVEEIIELFKKYDNHPHFRPPAERFMTFDELQDNIQNITHLTSRLSVAIESLSAAEIRWMNAYGCPDLNLLSIGVQALNKAAQKTNISYGKTAPLGENRIQAGCLSLTCNLKRLFEDHKIQVTRYRDGVFCRALNVLLGIKPDTSANPKTSDVSLNLLRHISKPNFTPDFF